MVENCIVYYIFKCTDVFSWLVIKGNLTVFFSFLSWNDSVAVVLILQTMVESHCLYQ